MAPLTTIGFVDVRRGKWCKLVMPLVFVLSSGKRKGHKIPKGELWMGQKQ